MGVDDGVAFSGGETGRVVAVVAAGSVAAVVAVVAVASTVGAGESLGPPHPTKKAATAAMGSPVLMRRHSAALTQNRNVRRVTCAAHDERPIPRVAALLGPSLAPLPG